MNKEVNLTAVKGLPITKTLNLVVIQRNMIHWNGNHRGDCIDLHLMHKLIIEGLLNLPHITTIK